MMARENVPLLDSGDKFPSMEFHTVDGSRLKLPDDFLGNWSVILFYRGDWCRQDRQQLLDFQLRSDIFKKLQIQVAATSAESLEAAQVTVKELRLSFPVGYGLDPRTISKLTGAYYDDTQSKPFLHATGFLLDPDGKVFNAVYSSRSIGRFTAQDAATLVEFIRNKEK